MKQIDFNKDWIFEKCDSNIEPIKVFLPYDAMIHEKRDAKCLNGRTTGYFPGGKYKYTKTFFVPNDWNDKSIYLEIEGSYQRTSIFVNGRKVIFHPYGYTGFTIDLSNNLNFNNENTIEIEVDNSDEPNTRWYSGSGIYRPVWLYLGNKCHIDVNGIEVKTISINPAIINVKTLSSSGIAHICIKKDNKIIATAIGNDVEIKIEDALLWNADKPNLYTCNVELFKNDVCVDKQYTSFGICKREWSTKGLFINGLETKLRGACIHHDNGVLGACEYKSSAIRKAKILKEAGFNAVRMAHNPASKYFLDACDLIGLYVMDEFTDMWYEHKNRFDYASYFDAWHIKDLTSMIKKGINHPSVLMYSIGNEVTETAEESGIRLTKEMVELCHNLDSTRPVTCGINMALNVMHFAGLGVYKPVNGDPIREKDPKNPKALAILNKMMETRKNTQANDKGEVASLFNGNSNAGEKQDGKLVGSEYFNNMMATMKEEQQKVVKQDIAKVLSEDAYAYLDIAGYNYAISRYELDKEDYPNRVSVGTETLPQRIFQNWKSVMACSYSLGDFIWTGWDYIGEAGVGAFCYDSVGTKDKDYPFLLAGSGIIDILGHTRPEVWLNKAVYGLTNKPYIGVEPLTHANENHLISAWRFSDAVHSWSWEGCEGNKAEIIVYCNAPYVALFKDGILIDKKETIECNAKFETIYTPGLLTAISYDQNGNELGKDEIKTATGNTKLKLTADKTTLIADGQDLCYLEIDLVGENNIIKCSDDCKLSISIAGPGELVGFGNANPCTDEIYTDNIHSTYYGRALAVVRSLTNEGIINVEVTGENSLKNQIKLEVVNNVNDNEI